MASTVPSTMINTIMDEFDYYTSELRVLEPFEYNGVYYLKQFVASPDIKSKGYNDFLSLFQNCFVCKSRLLKFIKIVDKNGPILLNSKLNRDQTEFVNNVCVGNFDIIVLDSSLLMNYERVQGGYPHLYFETKFTSEEKKPDLLQLAYRDYVTSGLLNRLIQNLLECNGYNNNEVIKSLDCFISCCRRTTYGDKFIQTAEWLKSIFKNINAKEDYEVIFIKSLIDTKVEKSLREGALVTSYHQANENILSLLRTARSEDAMIKMMTTRVAPENYQQKDPNAILKNGNIENALKFLGEFKNEIFSHDELSKLPHCITMSTKMPSTISAFERMKLSTSKKTYTSFASKCTNIKSITSISSLVAFLKENPESNIEINTLNMHPVYIAKTTLYPEKTNYPHLWLFANEFTVRQGWCKVKFVLPMYEYILTHKNIAFILDTKDISNRDKIKNCCLPEFLSNTYNKECGVAFQRINEMVQITMNHPDLALGVGTSISNGKIAHGRVILFKINGEEIRIIDV